MSLLDSGRKTPRKHGASVATSSGDLAEGGVGVREADYSRPQTTGAALAGVDRLLLVSSSEAGQRVAQHTNVIEAARTAGTSRIVYTSMLNADDSTNPLAGEHRDSERVLRDMGVPFRSTPPPDKRSASSAAPASMNGPAVVASARTYSIHTPRTAPRPHRRPTGVAGHRQTGRLEPP